MNKEKIKVYFVLPTLFAGGAERVISFVSQNISKERFSVKLIIIGFEKDSKYKTNNISTIYLNKNRVADSIIPIYKILRKEKPDIVLSSISHLNSFMGLISIFFGKIKFIGRHATINKVAKNYRAKRKTLLPKLNSRLFIYGIQNLDMIICQSEDMKLDFLESYNCNTNNIKKFITVGRLSKIKGQLRLLDVLAKLSYPFQFTIIGSGAYEQKIYDKIKDLNLVEKVNHIKFTDKVHHELIKHDMFLQGSYSEGFPNALLESCSVGVPVIAFNAPGGTKEIITNGINGYIVENEQELLEKLNEEKDWDPKTVRDTVFEKFNSEKIIGEYENLFISALNK